MVIPSTGWSLRESVHLSHLLSCFFGSSSFSIRPLSTPSASLMRTWDFSALVSSSIVFHSPTGVAWAKAVPAAASSAAAAMSLIMSVSSG